KRFPSRDKASAGGLHFFTALGIAYHNFGHPGIALLPPIEAFELMPKQDGEKMVEELEVGVSLRVVKKPTVPVVIVMEPARTQQASRVGTLRKH
ncbi:hypothetical protein L916_20125, partial [Phytophthora nicotianae]